MGRISGKYRAESFGGAARIRASWDSQGKKPRAKRERDGAERQAREKNRRDTKRPERNFLTCS